jgi:hypothetical protein
MGTKARRKTVWQRRRHVMFPVTTSRRMSSWRGRVSIPSGPLRSCPADRHFKKYNDDTFCIATSTALATGSNPWIRNVQWLVGSRRWPVAVVVVVSVAQANWHWH